MVLFLPVKEDSIEIVLVWLTSVPSVSKTLFQTPNEATRLFNSGRRFSTSLVSTRCGPTSPCNRREQYSQFTDEQIVSYQVCMVLFLSVKEDHWNCIGLAYFCAQFFEKTLLQSPNDATRLFRTGFCLFISLVTTRFGRISPCIHFYVLQLIVINLQLRDLEIFGVFFIYSIILKITCVLCE